MDLRGKGSVKSYGSDKSLGAGSFDFDQDQDREPHHDDGHRREVVVKIDPEAHFPMGLHAGGSHTGVSGHNSNYSSTVNTPRAGGVVPGSGVASSASTSPGSGADGGRDGESFSFKNRPPQSPSSPAMSAGGEGSDDPPSRLIGNFLRKQAAAGSEPTSRELRVSFQHARNRFSPSTSSASTSSYAGDSRNQASNEGRPPR
ncbi:hypothetical protein GUJ93_ZPchr0766g46493 [Zizania palustris]|uniref:Uncharacterized protein n=1 Tax=Zizania palustris TaxID=103762 RepID=A0A8J5RDY8_ZIZPA|nr:hypothetical protein GUJ93_ZPchr0766g46493 [Zizania palustris]